LVTVALVVSLFTLFSMSKIWAEVFQKAAAAGVVPRPAQVPWKDRVLLLGPVAALALLTLGIGFFPQYFFGFAERAAAQMLQPEIYIRAVLGPGV
jgi:multicomponent Na+:H+ antiporter subunit D